jgi:O-antigen/teichoic acid export membrane protein
MAWGLNRMAWLGAWRGLIKVVFVAGAVLGMHFTGATLLPLVLANFAAISLGAILLAVLWYSVWRTRVIQPHESAVHELPKQLLWGPVLYLGMATMLNLVFNNADTLILAGMTSSVEVGRYNAAYKLIFIILSGYYLITQSLFPFLSAAPYDLHLRAWLYRALLVVAAAGTAIAVGIAVFSRQILSIIYGNDLGSMSLLRVLAFALPMDFCTSLMAVFLASRGRDKLLLSLTVAAAALNIGLNFVLIPRMQAQGSAWATVVSYGFLFAALLMSVPLVNA